MNVERLRQLRRVVEAAPDSEFDMRDFTATGDCGTTHCAGGWFALDEWAQENTEILGIFFLEPISYPKQFYVGQRDHQTTFERLATLFDITRFDADRLFGAWLQPEKPHRIPKSAVIANIDAILAGEPTTQYPVEDEDE